VIRPAAWTAATQAKRPHPAAHPAWRMALQTSGQITDRGREHKRIKGQKDERKEEIMIIRTKPDRDPRSFPCSFPSLASPCWPFAARRPVRRVRQKAPPEEKEGTGRFVTCESGGNLFGWGPADSSRTCGDGERCLTSSTVRPRKGRSAPAGGRPDSRLHRSLSCQAAAGSGAPSPES
jgi:hypothetical protein